MERRDRDRRGPGPNTQPQGQRARAPQPNATPPLASYDDPNAYRSPGFQDVSQKPYAIDYAGLPKDDEDPDGQLFQPSLQGNGNVRTNFPSGGFQQPAGMNGRRPDRAGTDPNAYRSPSFASDPSRARRPGFSNAPAQRKSVSANPGPQASDGATPAADGDRPSRRERRSQRPRFETSCTACGAAAVVPFEPSAERPAFCKPCYEAKKDELGLGPGKRPNLTAG